VGLGVVADHIATGVDRLCLPGKVVDPGASEEEGAGHILGLERGQD
jgi:hypothetical protein